MTRSYETQPTQSREYMNGFLLRAISGCIALEAALSAASSIFRVLGGFLSYRLPL
jgi:hypothetical protein